MNLRHSFLAVVALILLGPAAARAQGGINLSWDDCGTFGHELKSFACDTNSGNDVLYVSVSSDIALPQLVGVELEVLFAFSNGTTVSPWWHLEAGGCRPSSLTGRFDFTGGPGSCYDVWLGQASGGVNWQSGYTQPSFARLRGVAAIPGSTSAPTGTEMYVFGFVIQHQKTVGNGSCAGCGDPACIVLTQVKMVQTVGVGDYVYTQPLNRQTASWACPSTYYFGGPPFEPSGCFSNCPVPARKKSWGTIKSLYR